MRIQVAGNRAARGIGPIVVTSYRRRVDQWIRGTWWDGVGQRTDHVGNRIPSQGHVLVDAKHRIGDVAVQIRCTLGAGVVDCDRVVDIITHLRQLGIALLGDIDRRVVIGKGTRHRLAWIKLNGTGILRVANRADTCGTDQEPAGGDIDFGHRIIVRCQRTRVVLLTIGQEEVGPVARIELEALRRAVRDRLFDDNDVALLQVVAEVVIGIVLI